MSAENKYTAHPNYTHGVSYLTKMFSTFKIYDTKIAKITAFFSEGGKNVI